MKVKLSRYGCSLSIISILCAISYCECAYYTQNVWEIIKLRAVTEPLELENYYKELRKQIADSTEQPQESNEPKKRAYVKKKICKNIFRSPYFETRLERWIDTDLEKVREELKTGHRAIFSLLYKKPADPKCAGLWSPYQYDNPYQLMRTVYLDSSGEPVDENVILCLVRDAQFDSVKQYYVSREYNVNVVEEAYPIIGRFIFSARDNNELVIKALAEESAISAEFFRRTKVIESFYMVKRKNFQATETPAEDPVCSLPLSDKLRLCASLFGASLFEKNGIAFSPETDKVHPDCQKKRVRIRTPIFAPFIRVVGRLVVNPHRIYTEWVIGCEASSNAGEANILFVSRGTHHNSIFVFAKSSNEDQSISVYGYFNNVSVVGDVRPIRVVEPTPMASNLLAYTHNTGIVQ